MRNGWFSGEEAGNGEIFITKAKAGFGAFAVEFGKVDAYIRVRRSAIGEGFDLATESGEFWIAGIVSVKNDDFWVELEKFGFGVDVGIDFAVRKIGWETVGDGRSIDGQTIESFAC